MARKLQVFSAVALVTLMIASVAHAQGRGFGRFRRGDLFRLAAHETVQKELGVATEQADKIREISEGYRSAQRELWEDIGVSGEELRDLADEERRKVFNEIREALQKLEDEHEPKLAEVLSKEQMTRLKQIRAQGGGLTKPGVVKALGLSEGRRSQLVALAEEFRGKRRELFQDGGGENRREKFQKLRSEQEEASVELLTADQKTKYVALKGKVFDVAQLRRRR